MASEWAREKAEQALLAAPLAWTHRNLSEVIAAALDEARAEGRAEALGGAIPLKDLMAEALAAARAEGRAEGERIGAERERWECYETASTAFAQFRGGSPAGVEQRVCEAIAARGPMRGPEEHEFRVSGEAFMGEGVRPYARQGRCSLCGKLVAAHVNRCGPDLEPRQREELAREEANRELSNRMRGPEEEE